jgi:hypothetical protein
MDSDFDELALAVRRPTLRRAGINAFGRSTQVPTSTSLSAAQDSATIAMLSNICGHLTSNIIDQRSSMCRHLVVRHSLWMKSVVRLLKSDSLAPP